MTRPLIIGHRGASAAAPENTLAAFRAALAARADGVELDVRLARDGVPVVIHDETLKRVSDVDAAVSGLTARELARADVGSWFNAAFPALADPAFANEAVPTLKQVLELLGGLSGPIYLELKCGEEDFALLTDAVAGTIGQSRLLSQIIVKSFHLPAIVRMRQRLPGVRTAALFAPRIVTLLNKQRHIVEAAKAAGAESLSIHYSLATRKLVTLANEHSMPVTIWTADHVRWVEKGKKLGLAAIITNDPARLINAA